MQNPLLSLIGRRRSLYTRMLGMTLCGVIVFVAYRIAIEPGRAQSTVKAASSSYFTPDGNLSYLKLSVAGSTWELGSKPAVEACWTDLSLSHHK